MHSNHAAVVTLLSIATAVTTSACGVADPPAVRTAQAAARAADSAFGGELARFEPLPGTRHVWAAVHGRPVSESGFSSGYGGHTPVRNYVFYDPDAGRARWLLGTEPAGAPPREVTAHVLVAPTDGPAAGAAGVDAEQPGVPAAARVGVARAVFYEVRERDTNGNGTIDGGDLAALAASATDGSGYQVLLPALREYLGAFWRGDGSAVVLYAGPNGPRAATVDVGRRRVVQDAALPGTPVR